MLYVDNKYVDSVYNLYYPNVIEKTEGRNKNNRIRLGLISKLFKNFNVDINMDSEIELKNVSIIETKIQPSIEEKIIKIVNDKYKNKPLILSNLVNEIQENGIYYFQGTFELLAIENKKGKNTIVNKNYKNNASGLIWKLRLINYEERDLNINMSMSGDKIMINYHHLTEEIEKYKRFTFNVIGKITKFDDNNFSVKPVVVFYV